MRERRKGSGKVTRDSHEGISTGLETWQRNGNGTGELEEKEVAGVSTGPQKEKSQKAQGIMT